MKKLFRNRTLLIITLTGSFLIMGTIYFIRLFRAEEKIFQSLINQAISFAIEKIPYLPIHKNNDNIHSFTDHTHPGKIIITYHLNNKLHRIDTTENVGSILKNRVNYDLCREYWNLKLLDSCFRCISPFPNLSVIFVRRAPTRQTIDSYPNLVSIPTVSPAGVFQLGHVHPDCLLAWYRLPFSIFWERQREGLLMSIIPFLLFLFYVILIIQKERRRKYDNLQVEKQVIFAHDLKTPLATNYRIEESLCTNRSLYSPRQTHETLTALYRQSSRLLTEIEQFIQPDFQQHNSVSSCELHRLLEQLIADYQYTHPHAHITLHYRIDSQEILGDPFHIPHIIENLLSNAVKHITTPVDIHIECYEDSKRRLCIRVRDNGPGIPRGNRKRILQSNLHIHHTTDSHGLGLAYIRQAVRAANGTFRLYSYKGKGTVFFIRFRPAALGTFHLSDLPQRLYQYTSIILLVAEIIWTFNLLKTEQTQFLEHESQLMEKSIAKTNARFHGMRGTNSTYFKNNQDMQTITIFRHGQDTTIPMNIYSKTNNIYDRLFYDLRDTLWNLDSLYCHYRAHTDNPYSVALLRKNTAGHIIDCTDTLGTTTAFPIIHTTPLGFLEGHQLEIRFYTPARIFLANHSDWLFLSLLFTVASIAAGFYLAHLTARLQAFNRFQREDVQYILCKLQPPLRAIAQQEKEWATQVNTLTHTELIRKINDNIARYHHVLRLVNVLLNRIVAFRTQQ